MNINDVIGGFKVVNKRSFDELKGTAVEMLHENREQDSFGLTETMSIKHSRFLSEPCRVTIRVFSIFWSTAFYAAQKNIPLKSRLSN